MIAIQGIHKRYNELEIFRDFHLDIPEHRITCFLGESGCGKSTLLNMVAGVTPYDQGSITGGSDGQSYIFQDTRLLPWATIEDNLDFVLKSIDGMDRKSVIQHYLDLVKLSDYKDYYPRELSGGMKQRVAIARAFAYPSKILLMDEPFQGLHLTLKEELMQAFLKLWKEDRRTVLFVTHDVEEALYLADDIYQLQGRPVQIMKHVHIPIAQSRRRVHSDELMTYRQALL